MFTSNQTETLSPWTDAECGLFFHTDDAGIKASMEFFKEHREFCENPRYVFNYDAGQEVIAVMKKGVSYEQ